MFETTCIVLVVAHCPESVCLPVTVNPAARTGAHEQLCHSGIASSRDSFLASPLPAELASLTPLFPYDYRVWLLVNYSWCFLKN